MDLSGMVAHHVLSLQAANSKGYGARDIRDVTTTPQSICGKRVEKFKQSVFQAITNGRKDKLT
jgi:hypothetical protein